MDSPRSCSVVGLARLFCWMTVAAVASPGATPAFAAPVNNPLLNDIWVDPLSQRSYDNMMEAAVSEQREMTQRYIQQSDFMLQMYMSAMIKQEAKREAGRARIFKKEATTGFTPAEASPTAAQLAAKFNDPKQRAVAAQSVAGQLGRFQAAAAARGGAVKSDAADIFAVAFVINFEVVNDESAAPGAARRKWLADRFGERLLADEVFQGTPDLERQMLVEQTALAAEAAAERLAAAKQASDPYTRRLARDAARANLNQFKGVWGRPPSGAELTPEGFGDRGERLRAQGKATTAFRATPQPMLPTLLAETPVSAGGGPDAARKASEDLRAFAEHAASAGAKLDDLADITAVCVKLTYHVHANGRDLTTRQFASTVKLFADYYLADPMWTGLPDDQRQLVCEQAEVAALRSWREYRRIVEGELPKQMAAFGYTSNLNLTNGWEAKRQLDGMFAFGGLKFDDYTLTEEGFLPHYGERLIKEGKATTRFHPSAKPLLPETLLRTPVATGGGPEAAKQAADDLRWFAELARQRRAPTDDIAHAAALAVASDYVILTNGQALSDRQYDSIVKLLGKRYLEDPRWAAIPDFARQEMAEAWATRAAQLQRDHCHVIEVEIPKKKADYLAIFRNVDAKTLDAWTANAGDFVRSKAKWHIDELVAPLKWEDFRLSEDGLAPAR